MTKALISWTRSAKSSRNGPHKLRRRDEFKNDVDRLLASFVRLDVPEAHRLERTLMAESMPPLVPLSFIGSIVGSGLGKLPKALTTVVSEILAASNYPGGNALGFAIDALFEKRQKQAREILLEELRRGDKTIANVADVEECAAILFRYMRAAQEGAARLNLRLMAQVIAGQAHRGTLVADEFLYYADILVSLRREEIILIAILHQERKKAEAYAPGYTSPPLLWARLADELVPGTFKSKSLMRATACAAMRSGLVITDETLDGVSYFTTSHLMDQMERLASIDEVLQKETDS